MKMILDVDTGIDDALALAYAVLSPEIELIGVTTTYGMAPVDYTYRNTRAVLDRLGADVPVFRGSKQPLELIRDYQPDLFHGKDGLGNVLGPLTEQPVSNQDAVDYIVDQARSVQHKLTLVTTAPLTNLARAIAKAPDIIGKIGKVVVMGGAVMTPGNVNKFAEANIIIDPHAARQVFDSALPVTMVGLDVTRKTLLSREDVARWRKNGTLLGCFLAEVTEHYLNAYAKAHPYLEGCALHDPLAVGVAKMPDLVTTVPMPVYVDLDEDTLGRTTEDIRRLSDPSTATRVCVQVDARRFMNDFFGYLG
ncbi:nucleoside hydrolase [Paenibacillus larvae]|uniref:Nucleoside hydrolase n=1 Tax=Paenibacillus larvae TaxID=1464 RepID=A0AAP5MW93_9BACL|nr:nucleoside hydrolase [Paenibacillus larvae]AQR76069.1 nucleoside hydrolase [Paenibacillus larvae subsp. larvae]AVF23195.1 purine nucleosidase [Paenibacillus larvae subsp. larvae]MCY7476681.1 nucleoside hydrolase [Paenibacillus larvae]MCY7488185.1 nucleoside hydrolase [Paenibacillus larvae]MCY9511523.1 nucleoside hydrolase [Paenibacillus larvae]